jgi:hypothetical protein
VSESLDVAAVLWTDAEIGDWRPWGDRRTQQRLIAIPRSGDIRQLLPWRLSTIVATAGRTSDDRAMTRRFRDSLGVFLLLTGGALTKSRQFGVTAHSSLVDHVASQLGSTPTYGIVLCGPPRANQKPVIQLHDGSGRTLAYVKVAWNDLTRRLLEDERIALDHLASLPDKGFSAPPVLATGTFGDATWLALGPVGVRRGMRPDPRRVDALAMTIERTGPPWEGPTADAGYVARLVRLAAGLPETEAAVERLVEQYSDRPMRLGATHGDFTPWNMLSGSPEPAVWDWERYHTGAPIGFDRLHLRTQIALRRDPASLPDTLRRLSRDLDDVLPDLPRVQRQAHLDWYMADLLCRYERDVDAHPTRLPGFVINLTDVLKERQAPT